MRSFIPTRSSLPCLRRPRPAPGFTLVELLVVIAIILVLASLALPAILRAREAARTATCASNLRQINLGMLQFVDANQFFPPYRWEDSNHVNRWGVNRPRWQWILADMLGRPLQNPDSLRTYDAQTLAAQTAGSGTVFGYPYLSTAALLGYPVGADAAVASGGDATYTLVPMDNAIFIDPSLIDPDPDPTTVGSGMATNSTSIRNGAYGYNIAYLGNSRTLDDLGDYPNSPYLNFPVSVNTVTDTSRTISFGDSRGGNLPHGGHSMTLDPPHQRVHPLDSWSGAGTTSGWGSPSPSLGAGTLTVYGGTTTTVNVNFDPYGPDETGTDIVIYNSPVEERHNGRGNVVFVDGHVENHTLQDLGYVVTPLPTGLANTFFQAPSDTAFPAAALATNLVNNFTGVNMAWPDYLTNATVNATPWTVPYGTVSGTDAAGDGFIENMSTNRYFTGDGRDESSRYFNVK